MTVKYPGRKGVKWRAARKLILASYDYCQMPGCLYPDRPLLKSTDPKYDYNNPLAATVHHTRAVSWTTDMHPDAREDLLSDPRFLLPAHRVCNERLGSRPTPAQVSPPASRDWGV